MIIFYFRYNRYLDMVCKGKVAPEELPPTEDAARLHGLRSHYQILKWLFLDSYDADPLEWGWELKENKLIPKHSTLEMAPPELSRIIRCGCSMNTERPCSSNTCACRKMGINCILSCRNCHGEECCNVRVSTYFLDFS